MLRRDHPGGEAGVYEVRKGGGSEAGENIPTDTQKRILLHTDIMQSAGTDGKRLAGGSGKRISGGDRAGRLRRDGRSLTAKEYLQQVKIKDARIQNLQRDKAALRELMYSLGNSGGEGERVQTSRDPDKFGTIYSRIDEKDRQIMESIDELVDFKLKVSAEINRINDGRYIDILYRKYVLCQSWKEISAETGYAERYAQRMNGQALLEFQKTHTEMLEKLK